jgi:phosphatidylethanolamine-binding protein (PEBP) family uncharacterized protein
MYYTSSLLAAAVTLLSVAQAQTPPGFKPKVTTKLNVMFNSTAVTTPGQLLAKSAAASMPQIALPSTTANTTSSATYVFIMMDLDLPPQGTNTTRRILLHAMTTGFKPSSEKLTGSSNANAMLLTSTSTGPASYIAPNPPPTDTMPHRYVEMLFAQPAGLSVPATEFANQAARLNFDIESFAQKNKLGAPLAANYFTVDGKAAAGGAGANGGSASRSGSGTPASTGAPAAFPGAAVRSVDVSLGLAGVLGGLVLAVI